MSFGGLNLILVTPGSWPERKGKKGVQDIYLYVLEMLLIRRAGTSFCAFVGTTNVPGEEARSRAVCSFRDFKAHSSKDVAITILASLLCLGWPWTFQEESLAGLGPAQTHSLECSVPENLPFLACALWLQSQTRSDPCAYWMSQMQRWLHYLFAASAPLPGWRGVNIRTSLKHLHQAPALLWSQPSVSLYQEMSVQNK